MISLIHNMILQILLSIVKDKPSHKIRFNHEHQNFYTAKSKVCKLITTLLTNIEGGMWFATIWTETRHNRIQIIWVALLS